MAKEVAVEKRAKISEAQQIMILAVLGASIFLGAALSFGMHMIKQISFNAKVISAEDQSIVAYSNAIKQTGICKSPKGEVYSDEELKNCNPDEIDVDDIPGTLRANILEDVASNSALSSVSTINARSCVNQATGKDYTYEELNKRYDDAKSSEERRTASSLIKSCSALRVIPDALPAFKNEEALLASLNKIFNISNWQPDSLSPSGSTSSASFGTGMNALSVRLSVENAGSETTLRILNNIEHSIREFNIDRATIEWSSGGLNLQAQATAYYMDESTLNEITTTIKAEEGKK
ncbi:hypothetical protein IJH23_03280 [Candidatus Saccharibacteria bacterium]|nr:hypothetical protein [Candidatus Saccharibacteria bacterium]